VPRPHPAIPGAYPPNARRLLVRIENDGVRLLGVYFKRGIHPHRSMAGKASEARSGRVIIVGYEALGEGGKVVADGWLPVETAPLVEWTDPDDPARIRCAEVPPEPPTFVLDLPLGAGASAVRFWRRIPGEGPNPEKWGRAALGEVRIP